MRYRVRNPTGRSRTYARCVICAEWQDDYDAFFEWYQVAKLRFPQFSGMKLEIDKDFLSRSFPGKLYSPETCLLIPHDINKFMTDHGEDRGKWPQGVDFLKGRLRVRCCGHKPTPYVGMFPVTAPWEAHNAYLTAKWDVAEDIIASYAIAGTVVDAGIWRYMAHLFAKASRREL
jgi:hypothetical protein